MKLSLINRHPRDARLTRNIEAHKYYIDNEREVAHNVTTLVYKHFKPFNSAQAIGGILRSNKYKTDPTYEYYGKSAAEIEAQWELNGKEARENGTRMHDNIERFYNDEDVNDDSAEFAQFLEYNNATRPNVYRTEWAVFDEELSIAGTIDCLVANPDGTYTIVDWKRSKEIKTSGESAHPPIAHLKSCNFYEYALQLNIYKYILEKNYDVKVAGLYLIVCHPNFKTYKRVDLPVLSREVGLIMDVMRMGVSLECLAFASKTSLFDLKTSSEKPAGNLYKMQNSKIEMDDSQKRAFDFMMEGRNVVLTSRAGCGKSMVIERFYRIKRAETSYIYLTATTGLSAMLIGGSTIHRVLGIGTGADSAENLIYRIKRSKELCALWTKMKILILDEISMLNPDLLDKLELIARLIRNNAAPFGGVQLIFSGDFLQLPPVKSPKGYCFNAQCWDRLFPTSNVVELVRNYRQDDVEFQQCLNECRYGVLSDKSDELLRRCERQIVCDEGIEPTNIYCTRQNVNEYNNARLDELHQKEPSLQFFNYEMDYEVFDEKSVPFPEYMLKDCIASENLFLCKGAQVILVANLDVESGLCNGSRGVVTHFNEGGFPVVRFLKGKTRCIDTHHKWDILKNDKVVMTIYQLPLILGFAITVHKSQGMTLDIVRFDMSNVFEKGQAYTALSRVRNSAGLELVGYSRHKIFAAPEAVEFYNKVRLNS